MSEYLKLPDSELILRIKHHDEGAFDELYKRYGKPLIVYVFKKLNDKEEARDVVQEIFSNIWKDREHLHVHSSTSAYLYRQALNRSLNIFRRQKVVQQYVASLADYLDMISEETDQEKLEQEFLAVIEREIAALPPKMREVLMLRKEEALSNKEIAERLHISEHTVATHIKRALKILRNRLGIVAFLFFLGGFWQQTSSCFIFFLFFFILEYPIFAVCVSCAYIR